MSGPCVSFKVEGLEEYLEKIKTGSVFEVARVLRDLFLLKSDKNRSFGERKMMDTAGQVERFKRRYKLEG